MKILQYKSESVSVQYNAVKCSEVPSKWSPIFGQLFGSAYSKRVVTVGGVEVGDESNWIACQMVSSFLGYSDTTGTVLSDTT